jgi:hypothetical protein
MKKVKNITLKLIGIVIVAAALAGCAITQEDVKFTWDEMKMHYGDKETPMPRIVVESKKVYSPDENRVLGMYYRELNLIVLYDGWDYDTIIHEFHHALGSKLGEKEYAYTDFRMERIFK